MQSLRELLSIFTVVSLPYQLRQYKCLTFVVSLLLLQFLRALWFALRERVSCLDELDMCTTRLRLQLPGEPATDDIHVIRPLQVQRCILLTIAISFLSHFILVKTDSVESSSNYLQKLFTKNLFTVR